MVGGESVHVSPRGSGTGIALKMIEKMLNDYKDIYSLLFCKKIKNEKSLKSFNIF
jgi:hypothetical protein